MTSGLDTTILCSLQGLACAGSIIFLSFSTAPFRRERTSHGGILLRTCEDLFAGRAGQLAGVLIRLQTRVFEQVIDRGGGIL